MDARLASYIRASAATDRAAYLDLVATVWDEGQVTGRSAAAVPALTEAVDPPGSQDLSITKQARLVLLLGLLAAAEDGIYRNDTITALRHSVRRYVGVLSRLGDDERLRTALFYLLGYFSDDRELIMKAARSATADADDLSRLERRLCPFDPAQPVIGRAWPSPAVWKLSEEEQQLDQEWIETIPAGNLKAAWDGETKALSDFAGAMACWVINNGLGTAMEPMPQLPAQRPPSGAASDDHLARVLTMLSCPACHGRLRMVDDGADCESCRTRYPVTDRLIDFSGGAMNRSAAMAPPMSARYERAIRPAFLRIVGGNWGSAVTLDDEDRYLIEHVNPADGPVLDLAAGSGRWTGVLARRLGAERVLALDLSTAMLAQFRSALPTVFCMRGTATALPFANQALGAVNCWNALQALPDPVAALIEAGRCLRPGGTLTIMTFRPADDPVYRWFQSGTAGSTLYPPEELEAHLSSAALSVREREMPENFVFITATRDDRAL